MNQFNFNSHPELTDEEFVTAAIAVFNGTQPNQAGVDAALGYIQAGNSRYDLIYNPSSGWIAQGYKGNSNDNWFANVPSWTPLVVIPVAVLVGLWLAWPAIKKVWAKAGGNSNYGSE